MANEVETLIFKAQTSDLVRARKDLNKLEKAANDAGNSTENTGRKQRTFGQILAQNKGKILAVTAALGAMAFAINRGLKAVEESGAEFSILNARLVTATGSTQAASKAFEDLNAFALETPFTLQESINGFALLKNLGLEPTRASMVSFANTSAAMGKSLEQMIEAVADATTFEFERLKEFGIKTKQEGDTVKFTFRGITTEVGKNADEVKRFLENIGNTAFAGAAIEQTKTLAGSISNLNQGFDNLKIAAGEAAGANAIFAKTNNDLATAISDPEFVEGLGILTARFASLKASAMSFASATASFIVDVFTTTENEIITQIASLNTQLDGLEDSTSNRAKRLRKAIRTQERLLSELREEKSPTTDAAVTEDGTGTTESVDAETPEQIRARLAQEAADKEKTIQEELNQFKLDQIPTRLEILKQEHLAELEEKQKHKEMLQELDDTGNLNLLQGKAKTSELLKKLSDKDIKIESITADQKKKLLIGTAGNMLSFMAGNSKKMFKLQKAAGIANALVSVGRGVTKAMELPFPMNLAAAATVAMQGAMEVNKLKSVQFQGGGSPSGGGTSGSIAASGSNLAAQDASNMTPTQPQEIEQERPADRVVNVTINDSIDPAGARRIVEALNEATEDGLEINALVA